jgi:hypothetical protein
LKTTVFFASEYWSNNESPANQPSFTQQQFRDFFPMASDASVFMRLQADAAAALLHGSAQTPEVLGSMTH